MFFMPPRVTTLEDEPGLLELRLLEKRLTAHIDRLDERVDRLLYSTRSPTEAEVGEMDVLCAAIAEARELLDEARHEAAVETMSRRLRRTRPKRWV